MTNLPRRTQLARTYHLLRAAWTPAPGSGNAVLVMVMIASLITGLAIMQVSRRHEIVRTGYALSKESQRLETLREHNRALSVELATLTTPERLRELAEKLGMVPARPEQVREVRPTGPIARAP
jgi:cell division protein FtsL